MNYFKLEGAAEKTVDEESSQMAIQVFFKRERE